MGAGNLDYYSKAYIANLDWYVDGYASNETYGEYSADNYVDSLISNYENRESEDKPMFMYYAAQSVHSPLEVDEEWLDLYEDVDFDGDDDRKTMLAMVSQFDDGIGRLLDAIDLDNTIVIFSGDNGGGSNMGSSNYPYRGQKSGHFEGGIKTHGFIYPADALPVEAGSTNFHIMDWIPTLQGGFYRFVSGPGDKFFEISIY